MSKYVSPEKRRFFFFGLDYEGDPSVFVLFFTITWYKDHAIKRLGNHVMYRQTTEMYRKMLRGLQQ